MGPAMIVHPEFCCGDVVCHLPAGLHLWISGEQVPHFFCPGPAGEVALDDPSRMDFEIGILIVRGFFHVCILCMYYLAGPGHRCSFWRKTAPVPDARKNSRM